VDPLRGSSTAALGQLYIILATLVFLSLGGHLALIEVLVAGFTPMPIGAALPHEGLWAIVLWGGTLFSGAISIALPGVTALLIVNLAFGVMSRAAPSLNLFAVGFPISLIVGLVVVLAGMGPLVEGITQLIGQGLRFLRELSGV
jgi:flagellar biosynthetic protein FliR